MITKEEAKKEIKKLVEEFSSIPKSNLDSMPEEDIKFKFIEPLFEILGWERKDINKEPRVLKGRADYIFRLTNKELLVVEAKKTNVHLSEEQGRQAVSYAYHRKIKFSVLTNFKHIRVYHALSNIKNIDKNLLKKDGAYFILEAKEFLDKFDLLWLLSKESFEKEEINKLLSAKDERLAKPIDESILVDLLEIRELLSKDLKKLRNYLGDEKIDEAIQILINRFIFMRSVEDRGLENKNFLLGIRKDFREGRLRKRLWDALEIQFKIFNKMYNSKLFAPSILENEKDIFFDDDTLDKIIWILYFGTQGQQARYMFDQIPSDLLGGIYEQYLGTILRGTEKRVRLESKTGKRKKMGIYYTPSYVVDYIVKNTVGEYIKDKTIDEILDVKIVDPACGSGSFLIRAFQEVCNVIEKRLKEGEKSKNYQHTFQELKGKLSLGEKATILTNCIYGVDLDEKAVELTQLNLLLKILEEEGRDIPNKRLPNLFENIKCGNSLISDSHYDKAFNWDAQFPFKFDVVVGNPPYIRVQEMKRKDVEYFSKNFQTSKGYLDTYMLFTEKSINLVKEKGIFSFIMPNKFMTANYGKGLREFILKNSMIVSILDFGDLPVFESATTYPAIYVFKKERKNSTFSYIKVENLKEAINENFSSLSTIEQKSLSHSPWILGDSKRFKIISKLNELNLKLGNISNKIFQGLITSADSVYILTKKNNSLFSKSLNKFVYIEQGILKNLVKGMEIKKYSPLNSGRFLIFPYKKQDSKYVLLTEKELSEKFPKAYEYLKENVSLLKSRNDVKKNKILWYGFSRPQNLEEFEKEKILTPFNAFSNSFTIDFNNRWFFTAGVAGGYGILLKPNIDKKVVLGILNSKLVEFYIKNTSTYLRGHYYSYENRFIKNLPIKIPDEKQAKRIKELVERIMQFHKEEKSEQDIKNVDYEIDQEIYKLYDLTPEEIKIIEEGLK